MTTVDLSAYRPIAVPRRRVGRRRDGGYVVPADAVPRSDVLVSIGIGCDISFDWGFKRCNPSTRIVALDGTVSAGRFVRAALSGVVRGPYEGVLAGSVDEGVDYIRSSIDAVAGALGFLFLFAQRRHKFIHANVDGEAKGGGYGLETIIEEVALTGGGSACRDVFLKMDIEGGEYDVVGGIPLVENRLTGLVIEWHNLEGRWDDFKRCMDLLLEDFAVCHIHGNNNRGLIPGTSVPSVLEVSFVSRRLVRSEVPYVNESLPVEGLDYPNNPARDDLPLFW